MYTKLFKTATLGIFLEVGGHVAGAVLDSLRSRLQPLPLAP